MAWLRLNFGSNCSENMVTLWNTWSHDPLLWPVLFSANCDDVTIGFLSLYTCQTHKGLLDVVVYAEGLQANLFEGREYWHTAH